MVAPEGYRPSWIKQMVINSGVFLGGCFAGIVAAEQLGYPTLLGMVTLPAAFMVSLAVWNGVACVLGGFNWLISNKKNRDAEEIADEKGERQGAFVLLLVPAVVAAAFGFVSANFDPQQRELAVTMGGFAAAGAAYGLILFVIARLGYLDLDQFFAEYH
jgi:hypothetical protein